MDVVEPKRKRYVARGSRRRDGERRKQCFMLSDNTSMKLAALAAHQRRDQCDIVEEALNNHMAGMRVCLPGDKDGQSPAVT